MSPSWIWSDRITNERIARVGSNQSNKGEWNNCFRKFSNRVLPPIFISTILQSGKFWNLAHYFPYDVKLRLLAHSRSFLANQNARNAIVRTANLLIANSLLAQIFLELVTLFHEGSWTKVLKTRFYSNFSLNLFQIFHLGGEIWLRCWIIVSA